MIFMSKVIIIFVSAHILQKMNDFFLKINKK